MGKEALLIIYHSTPQTSIKIPCSASVPTFGDMARASGGMTGSSHSCSPKNYSRHKRRDETALVEKYYQYLYKHVSTIIPFLDPSAPRLRKALLQATTASLHVLGALSLDNNGKRQSESCSIAGSIISPRNHTILVQDVISIVMNIHHMHEVYEWNSNMVQEQCFECLIGRRWWYERPMFFYCCCYLEFDKLVVFSYFECRTVITEESYDSVFCGVFAIVV